MTSPGYTIPERGARFAGGDVARLSLTEANGFLPDLHAVDASTWSRTAALWLNYPNNPTGATAPLDFLKEAADHCRSHDVLLASDEAYRELWFEGEPPASALQVGDLTNVLVFHTLSKRSSMTGYRSGFVAGDPEMISALRALRPSVGVTPQEFVQRASIAAWNDEVHVEEVRGTYARKRKLFLDLFASRGVRVAGSAATFYLWVAVPEDGRRSRGRSSSSTARTCSSHPARSWDRGGGVRADGDGAHDRGLRARGRGTRSSPGGRCRMSVIELAERIDAVVGGSRIAPMPLPWRKPSGCSIVAKPGWQSPTEMDGR